MKLRHQSMFIASLLFFISQAFAAGPLPAFPGTEGWGAYTALWPMITE